MFFIGEKVYYFREINELTRKLVSQAQISIPGETIVTGFPAKDYLFVLTKSGKLLKSKLKTYDDSKGKKIIFEYPNIGRKWCGMNFVDMLGYNSNVIILLDRIGKIFTLAQNFESLCFTNMDISNLHLFDLKEISVPNKKKVIKISAHCDNEFGCAFITEDDCVYSYSYDRYDPGTVKPIFKKNDKVKIVDLATGYTQHLFLSTVGNVYRYCNNFERLKKPVLIEMGGKEIKKYLLVRLLYTL